MKSVSRAAAVTLGACVLALSPPRPSLALDGVVGPFRPNLGSVIAQPTPPIIDVITPAPAIDPATLFVIPPDYSPSALNVGTVRAYKSERRTAVVTIKAKFDETITAQLKPAGPFQITRLTSYKYGMPMVSIQSVGATPRLKVRTAVQSVTGGQALPVKAGQEVDVEVALTGTESMPAQPRTTLSVSGAHWSLSVPVSAFVMQQPEITAESQTDAIKVAIGDEREYVVRLMRAETAMPAAPVARNVTLTSYTLPAGVSMEPVTVHVPADAPFVDAKLRLRASEYAPQASWQTAEFLVDTGVERQIVSLDAHVYPKQAVWKYEHQAGNVHVKGELLVRCDGSWRWLVDMTSSAGLIGDRYIIGFSLKQPFDYQTWNGAPRFFGSYAKGGIGGTIASGPKHVIVKQDSLDYPAGTTAQWMRDNYFNIADTGCEFRSKVFTDHNTWAKAVQDFMGGAFIDLLKGGVGG
jgi:hypothetical protein